jgi:Uma2 family endonuclease
MIQRLQSISQNDPPLSPRETLPTMYDLPSEDPEEPGLPDEFHDLQPQFLSATLRLKNYAKDQYFTGTDLNLYYDLNHLKGYKRPDWFLSVGVPRRYDQNGLRLSYVMWQERVSPLVVVEVQQQRAEQEQQRAEREAQRANTAEEQVRQSEEQVRQVVASLLLANMSVSQIVSMTGLTAEQIERMRQ